MIFFVGQQLFAQSPEKINYQAVARSITTGKELPNTNIYLICKLRAGGNDGTIVYQEEHNNVVTDQFGLFQFQIGDGISLFGNFESINWGASQYWLELEIDGGSGLESVGSMQFVSVPYALHAKTADNVDDADADPNNELINSLQYDPQTTSLIISEGGESHILDLSSLITGSGGIIENVSFSDNSGILNINESGTTHNVDLSSLKNDADADPENELISFISLDTVTHVLRITEGTHNSEISLSSLVNANSTIESETDELITSFAFDSNTGNLIIQEGTDTYTVNLSTLLNDSDADPTNELNNALSFDNSTNTLSLTDAGGAITTDLSSLAEDADADPANELNIDLSFNNTTNTLTLTDSGGDITADLSSLVEDADADSTNELQNLSQVLAYPLGNGVGDAGGQRIGNLGIPVDSNDAATKIYVDNLELFGDVIQARDNNKVVAIQGRAISDMVPEDGSILRYDSTIEKWMSYVPTPTTTIGYYSIDPSDFVGTRNLGNDVDNIVIYSGDNSFVSIRHPDDSNFVIAPIHLPHNARITALHTSNNCISFFTSVELQIQRKDIMTNAITNIYSISLPCGNGPASSIILNDVNLSALPVNISTIDNSQYTYRMVVELNNMFTYQYPSDANVRFYGARITYTE